jgi:hypothetical protein
MALTMFLSLSVGCATMSSSDSSASSPGDKSQLTVSVTSPPPAERAEDAHAAAPGFGFIWVAGYWDYLDGNYIWREGRWMQGKADYEYVRARYEHDAQGWVFHRPHWKRRHASVSMQQAAAR